MLACVSRRTSGAPGKEIHRKTMSLRTNLPKHSPLGQKFCMLLWRLQAFTVIGTRKSRSMPRRMTPSYFNAQAPHSFSKRSRNPKPVIELPKKHEIFSVGLAESALGNSFRRSCLFRAFSQSGLLHTEILLYLSFKLGDFPARRPKRHS